MGGGDDLACVLVVERPVATMAATPRPVAATLIFAILVLNLCYQAHRARYDTGIGFCSRSPGRH